MSKKKFRHNRFLVTAVLLHAISLAAQQTKRLNDNWEFLKQDVGGIGEAVRPVKKGDPEEVPLWTKVLLNGMFDLGLSTSASSAGRAIIRVKVNNGKSVVSAKVENVPTGFINL